MCHPQLRSFLGSKGAPPRRSYPTSQDIARLCRFGAELPLSRQYWSHRTAELKLTHSFLRRFSDFHHGIPCKHWLRTPANRIDPALLRRSFNSWIAALGPKRHEFIAIDGKTARRNPRPAQRAQGPAYAQRLRYPCKADIGAVESVPEKTNEITAIPNLLDQLAETKQLEGALVTIDAMGCQVEIANKIVAHKADCLLPLKGNQPTLEADVEDYFCTAPAGELVSKTTVEKGHGRIETRTYAASSNVDWISSERSYPGQPRFKNIKTVIRVLARAEYADRCSFDTHHYISSAPLDIERIARAARSHWGVESMYWLLDANSRMTYRAIGPATEPGTWPPPLRSRPRARQQGQGQRQDPMQNRRPGLQTCFCAAPGRPR
jgi:predicted transposase YbfD/YdcC